MKIIVRMMFFIAVLSGLVISSCLPRRNAIFTNAQRELALPDVLPHGSITNVVDDVFFVMGTNLITHDNMRIQASRTMTIIREKGELTLVNSMRLNDAGLRELAKLGRIKNVVRIGAFHGRDDAFYQNIYGAKLWAFPTMEFSHGEIVDHDLSKEALPIAGARIIEFKTTQFKEALLLLERAGGILVSCDSIKNWQAKDQFFDDPTFILMKTAGSIGDAKIDATWLGAMRPSAEEISAIGNLAFTTLLSAHGLPLRDNVKDKIAIAIRDALHTLQKSESESK